MINRGVSYKSSEVISRLYRADMLKGFQRATKMIPSLRNLSCEERLKKLGMFSLRRRRLEGDMIEMFKMIKGIDKVNLGKLF